MDNITQLLAYVGAAYIGFTIAIVLFFIAVKRLRTPDEVERDEMEEAETLLKTELDATPIQTPTKV